MSKSVLVVVGYRSGYGGSFFSSLLQRSLNQSMQEIMPINDSNEYSFDTDAMGIERYYINRLLDIKDKGYESLRYDIFFEDETIKTIISKVDDSDRFKFSKNLSDYLMKNVNLNAGFNVVNAHYTKKFDGFSIHDIHEKVVFLLLKADNPMHDLLFEILVGIKKNHFKFPELVAFYLKDLKEKLKRVEPFDRCYEIDVGKLFLQRNNNLKEVEEVLSKALCFKISLDKNLIKDYTVSNITVLNNFLDLNVEDSSYFYVMKAAEKKLKSLL